MQPVRVTFESLPGLAGRELGHSAWHTVTQDTVNAFARATGDWQWIHVDAERAARELPGGAPIAHGYYTLSLIPNLLGQLLVVDDARLALNYGLNRVRFPAPAPVGSRLRLRAQIQKAHAGQGYVQTTISATIEREAEPKPVCVAEAVFRFYA